MGDILGTDESHSLRGPIDRAVLIGIRDVISAHEPLATATIDDFLNPRVLEVRIEDGLRDAESAHIDVQWTTCGDYAFHYTDSTGLNFRWGRHDHDGHYVYTTGLAHYHPPPNASANPAEVEDSCITQSRPLLVTLAVLKLWRTAYHDELLSLLNSGSNPP